MIYREAHILLEEIAEALGIRKLGPTAAGEELLGTMMCHHKLLGDSVAVTAMLDQLLHQGHILKCGP